MKAQKLPQPLHIIVKLRHVCLRGAPYEQSTDQLETHLARPEPPQAERTLSKGPTEFQERPGGTQDEPRWAQRELTKAQDGRVGLKMGPTWPKMHQHGPKGSLTWPRKAPRSCQDGQVGAKMEPTWPQDGPRCANMAPRELNMAQESVKIGASWSQDGANMAPRWPGCASMG